MMTSFDKLIYKNYVLISALRSFRRLKMTKLMVYSKLDGGNYISMPIEV